MSSQDYPPPPHLPPEMKSWPELGTSSFESSRIPPPQKKLELDCAETNRCIPQGYGLVTKMQNVQVDHNDYEADFRTKCSRSLRTLNLVSTFKLDTHTRKLFQNNVQNSDSGVVIRKALKKKQSKL